MKNAKKRSELLAKIADLEKIREEKIQEARRQAILWENSLSVHSLRRHCDGEDQEEQWTGEVWKSEDAMEEIVLDEDYVKDLLTPFAFNKVCFCSTTFVALQEYDRQRTVDETHWHHIKCVNEDSYTLFGDYGKKVFHPLSAADHIPAAQQMFYRRSTLS